MRAYLVLVFLALACPLLAGTQTATHGGYTATVYGYWNPATSLYEVTWSALPSWTGPTGNPDLAQIIVQNDITHADVWVVTCNNVEGHGRTGSTTANTASWGTRIKIIARVLSYPSYSVVAGPNTELIDSTGAGSYRVGPMVNSMKVEVKVAAIDHTTSSLLGSQTAAPGATVDFTVSVPSGHNVDVKLFVRSVYGDGVWEEVATLDDGQSTTIVSNATPTGPGGTPPTTNPSLAGVAAPGAVNTTSVTNNNTVWSMTNATATTTLGTTLDKDTFKEGVGKLETILAAKAAQDAATLAAWDANKALDYYTSANAQGTTGSNAIHTLLDSKVGVTVGTAPTPSADDWAVTFYRGAHVVDQTVSTGPWDVAEVHSAAAFWRGVLAIALGIWYCYFVVDSVVELVRGMVGAKQAKGNTVAGSFGQVTGLLSAAVITILTLAAPVALVALADTGLLWGSSQNVQSLITALDSTLATKFFSLWYEFFPVGTMIAVLHGWLVMRIGGAAILMGVQIAISYVQFCIIFGLCLYAATADASASIRLRYQNASAVAHNVDLYKADASALVGANVVNAGAVLNTTYAAPGYSQLMLIVNDGTVSKRFVVEVLDHGTICMNSGEAPQVSHDVLAWVDYWWLGFRIGCGFELFGVLYRLFRHMGASTET